MLPIFTDAYFPRGSISRSPKADWFRTQVKRSVEEIQSYWTGTVHRVYSQYPLVQALKHLGSPSYSPVDLYDTADARAPYLSKNLKFTTDYNVGALNALKVYPTKDSLIYSASNYIRPHQAVDNWKTLQPLKTLWLDSDLVDLSIPNELGDVQDSFSAVSVDLPMLVLMYKGFHQEQSMQEEVILSEEQFVSTWVLPAILETQVDISCVSSLISVYEGTYEKTNRVKINRYVPSYGYEYFDIANFVLNKVSDTRMPYVQILQHIPAVYKTNALEALALPNFAPTIQVDWAMFASRLRVVNFLLDVGGRTGQKANQGFINQLKRYTREIRNNRVPYDRMSPALAGYIENSLTRFTKLP